jgi:hypothetical protein
MKCSFFFICFVPEHIFKTTCGGLFFGASTKP